MGKTSHESADGIVEFFSECGEEGATASGYVCPQRITKASVRRMTGSS
jgi:hypothetical protein